MSVQVMYWKSNIPYAQGRSYGFGEIITVAKNTHVWGKGDQKMIDEGRVGIVALTRVRAVEDMAEFLAARAVRFKDAGNLPLALSATVAELRDQHLEMKPSATGNERTVG